MIGNLGETTLPNRSKDRQSGFDQRLRRAPSRVLAGRFGVGDRLKAQRPVDRRADLFRHFAETQRLGAGYRQGLARASGILHARDRDIGDVVGVNERNLPSSVADQTTPSDLIDAAQ